MVLKYRHCLARDSETKRWHVRKVVHGVVHHRSFRSKSSAEKFLQKLEEVAAGLVPDAELTGPRSQTVRDCISYYIERRRNLNRSNTTITYYQAIARTLTRVFGGQRPVNRIFQADIDTYIQRRLSEGVTGFTITKEIKFLARVITHAGATPGFRAEALPHTAKERTMWPMETIARFWHALPPIERRGVTLALCTGIRAAEVHRADYSWIDWDRGTFRAEVRKTSRYNTFPMMPLLVEQLEHRESGLIIPKRSYQVRNVLERASKEVGIDPPIMGFGHFRHQLATWVIEAGGSHSDVQLLLAHNVPGVTGTYTHAAVIEPKRRILEPLIEAFQQQIKVTL